MERHEEMKEYPEMKDRTYSSQNNYADEATAMREFKRSVSKLFDVNSWSDLPGISSTFKLFSIEGKEKHAKKPLKGDYIRILLPFPSPENWVVVSDLRTGENFAQFTVNPGIDPTQENTSGKIEHFFIKESSSTFRVEIDGKNIKASEIGKHEAINKREDSGNRTLINIILARGGWAGFQKFQWIKLTDYLVHKTEI